jgi:hypothetical protein
VPGPWHPSSPAGGSAVASTATAAGLGGIAMLALLLSLAGPALLRRLVVRPAQWRPVAFVALHERPG